MKTRLKDIAEKLGVSLMTASRAVNNGYGIKKETREKILKAVEKFNYHPNNVARSLVTKKTHTIGLIIPDITNPFFPLVIKGCEEVINAKGYRLFLCNSQEDSNREKEEIEALLERRVDGLAIVPADSNDKELYLQLKKAKMPFVLLDRYWKSADCSYVLCKNTFGAELATNYLIELGHKRIAHIAGPLKITTSETRLKGYKNAMRKNNLPVNEDLIIEAGIDVESGYSAMKRLLDLRNLPTAIFAYNDEVAIGVMEAIEESGLKIPANISVAGFDDIPEAKRLRIPLTTIRQPKEELGRLAMEILFEKIESKIKKERRIELEPELIIRNSCALK